MMTKAEQIEMVVQWLRKHCPEGALFSDSREVAKTEKEAVFFSYHEGDSKKYIANAIENGAKAILYEEASLIWPAKWQIPHLPVKGLKELAGPIAAAYYGQPSKSMFVVAVTGTNGKTSCTQWLGATLSRLGEKTAVIGTLGVVLFEKGE
ncbi:MAG: Mur ligase family protein, partial [bacterium]|nr:Mur ligase family protein [bacterium]